MDKSSKPDPWWMPANEDLKALSEALVYKAQGSFAVVFKLMGLVGKRVKAIQELGGGK